jgi:hypothetical protein
VDPSRNEKIVAIKGHRDELVARHRDTRAIYNRAMDEHAAQVGEPAEIGIDASNDTFVDTPAYQRARAALADMKTIEDEFFAALPRQALAPCPHCGKPLFRTFDPFGLDGLWWRSDAHPDEPQACPHFCLLQGAVDLRTSRPAPDFDVHPGPGAPYVIPRLLEPEGMLVVISQVTMLDGALAYPIVYFAARRPPAQTLAASWARTNFGYSTQLGVHGWRRSDDPVDAVGYDTWDFALEPWLARGKIQWCDPDSDGTALSRGTTCAFVGLPGSQRAQVIAQVGPTAPSGV